MDKPNILYKGFWMCILDFNRVVSIDGGHSSVKGVIKAVKLHEWIFKESREKKMVEVKKDIVLYPQENWTQGIDRLVQERILFLKDIPHKKVKVNEEMMNICASMVGRK